MDTAPVKKKPQQRKSKGKLLNDGVEMVQTRLLTMHPDNPRRGSIKTIVESIRVNGFYGSLVVQRGTNRILVGNHRFLAAQDLQMPEVPVTWVDVDDVKARKILLADNRSHDLGSYDADSLLRLLAEISESGDGFDGTGYDDSAVATLLGSLTSEEDDDGTGEDEEGEREPQANFRPVILETAHKCPRCAYEWD